jgi:hypothetical protein
MPHLLLIFFFRLVVIGQNYYSRGRIVEWAISHTEA